MNKIAICIISMSSCLLSTTTFAQNTTNVKDQKASLVGAWHSADYKEFLVITDGFFSSILQDSTGNWSEAYAGTYTIDNPNTITLKATHSSIAYRIGYLHTIEYELKGDNLTFKLYNKLVDPKAGDVTARMPKGQTTLYIRAKP